VAEFPQGALVSDSLKQRVFVGRGEIVFREKFVDSGKGGMKFRRGSPLVKFFPDGKHLREHFLKRRVGPGGRGGGS